MPFILPEYLKKLVEELPGDKNCWKYFFSVTQIPRGSNQDGECFRHHKITKYLVECAKELGCDVSIDKGENIIIRKQATAGLESKPTVCLQCHMDMVCEKDDSTNINFDTDPLTPYSDGKYIRAKGTSLGADNGIGIGSCFAILANKEIQHGPLEVLVTRDEETGLFGATDLEQGILKAKYLINVDNEDRNMICIGCAGGFTITMNLDTPRESLDGYIKKTLVLNNFIGGHSGCDIHLGRANCMHIMARMLKSVNQSIDYRILSINCGSAHNAIPRKCIVEISIPENQLTTFTEEMNLEFSKFSHEYKLIETTATFSIEDSTTSLLPTTSTCTKTFVNFLNFFPFGPTRMSPDVQGLVETSITCAIGKVISDNTIQFTASVRSSSKSQIDSMYTKVMSICEVCGIQLSAKNGEYPGWEPNPTGFVTQCLRQAYISTQKTDPIIYACHAGLECGLIQEKYPQMDCTSVGPEVLSPHSPDEKLLIVSVDEFMHVLEQALLNLIQ
ncbi:hypothetical protein WA158_003817 [Blastocystis sp. Blastoise]